MLRSGGRSRQGPCARSAARVFNHERSRRSRRRLAAPVSRSPCNDMSTTKVFRKSYSRKADLGGKRLGGGGGSDVELGGGCGPDG